MRHFSSLLCICILWVFPDALFAQKKLNSWDQIEWLVFNKDFPAAQIQLQKILNEDPKKQDLAHYWQGLILLKTQKTEEAKALFQQKIELKEKSPYAWVGLAHYYELKGDLSFAQSQLNKAIKYGKARDLELELAIMRLNLEGKQKSNAGARAILSNISEKRPEDISPRLILFDFYQKLGVVEPAEEIGLELSRLLSKSPKIYVDIAELYLDRWNSSYEHLNREGSLKTAYRYIQEAFADDPKYPDAFRVRAEIYLRSSFPDKYEKAKNDMATYLKLRQNDREAKIRYAKFLFLAEEYQPALKLISELEGEGIEDKVLKRLKGIGLSKVKKWGKAKVAMEAYFEQVKAEYRISLDYETYGDILRQLQSPEAAQDYYQLAIDLNEERVSLYGEIADEYFAEAKGIEKKLKELKSSGKTSYKELQKFIASYNQLAQIENPTQEQLKEAADLKDEIQLLQDQMEIFSKDSQELDEKVLAVYEKEAFYREKALRFEDNLSLRNQRKYADALFNSRNYELAERAYSDIHELKEDYLYPYERRLQIALRLARTDGTDGPGLERAVPVSQDIIRIFLPKVDELKERQQKSVLIALESMAIYSFDPQGEQINDCQAAKPYLDQMKSIDQAYLDKKDGLKLIDGFCEE
ncbi:MAG: hypothetical protein R8P61_29860 [Bacteroidia bacterium]|nr:hypothetical protein [Bacteroidia bacterium]